MTKTSTNGGKKKLRSFPAHSIVKVNGRWGVLCIAFGHDITRTGERVVDFWDGGLELVDGNTLAIGLPEKER